jgi:hypothetical protein
MNQKGTTNEERECDCPWAAASPLNTETSLTRSEDAVAEDNFHFQVDQFSKTHTNNPTLKRVCLVEIVIASRMVVNSYATYSIDIVG